jgi:hypothetical protein
MRYSKIALQTVSFYKTKHKIKDAESKYLKEKWVEKFHGHQKMERATGIEPATCSLENCHSTIELRPRLPLNSSR